MKVGAEDLERRLEPVLLLGVDGERQPARARRARQADQTRRQLLGKALLFAGLEARMQRRQLHRQARPLVERVEMHGGERPRGLAYGIDRRHVALEVEVGVLLRPRRLAQHVVGEEIALLLVRLGARHRLADGAPEHELIAEDLYGLAHGLADDGLARARNQALDRVDRVGAVRVLELDDAAREQQRPGRGVDEQAVGMAEMALPAPARKSSRR